MAGTVNTFDTNTQNYSYSPILKIRNGTFEVNYTETIDNAFAEMDESLKIQFDQLNGFSILPSLATHLKDADVKMGFNIAYSQELICKGWFLPPNTYDCGSFVVNGTAVVGKEPKKPYNRCKSTQKGANSYEISI